MAYNPTLPLRLDAYPVYRGSSLHAKGNITDTLMRGSEVFTIQSGREIAFSNDVVGEINVPVVAPVATLVPWLQYYSAQRFGTSMAPHQFAVVSLVNGTSVVTITAHPFVDGDAVYPRTEELFPASSPAMDPGTVLYIGNKTTDTFKLYGESAHAIAGTGASLIDFSADTGTGIWWLALQLPLVVNRRSGVARTWLNACPIKFPSLTSNSGKLFWDGDLGFRAYPKIGGALSDGVAAFYTEAAAAYTSPTWDTGAILTSQSLTAAWGGSAPWSAMFGEQGAALTFEPTLEAQGNGIWPHITDIMTGFKITAKIKPIGITVPQIAALFNEMPGAQLTTNNLVLTFGGYVFTLYSAALMTPVAAIFSAKDSVMPELEFTALGNASTNDKPGFLIAAA